ncbi:MAG: RNA polymerase sigma factor [candidate division FCPU426 bacterium]
MICNTEDQTLISRFMAGNQASGDEIARRYYPRVLSVCFQFLRSSEAHDAAQNVFLKVLGQRKISTFHGEARLWTWLYRVTVNTCYKHMALQMAHVVKTLPLAEQSWFENCLPASEQNPEDLNALREQLEQMVKMIYFLHETYRDPLILVYLRGYTYAEAAAELQCTPRALGVRLTRAKKQLAELMKKSNSDLTSSVILYGKKCCNNRATGRL